jgi:hypothetical protein
MIRAHLAGQSGWRWNGEDRTATSSAIPGRGSTSINF